MDASNMDSTARLDPAKFCSQKSKPDRLVPQLTAQTIY